MNMSRIENYNEEQKLYLLYCIRGVVDTVEDARKDTTTTTLRRKSKVGGTFKEFMEALEG